jgi:hypothetical protein
VPVNEDLVGMKTYRDGPGQAAHWYTSYRPGRHTFHPGRLSQPVLASSSHPHACRLRGADRLAARAWNLSAGPFTIATVTDDRCPLPANPKTYDLIDQVWTTLRATQPELAAAADAHGAGHWRRAQQA